MCTVSERQFESCCNRHDDRLLFGSILLEKILTVVLGYVVNREGNWSAIRNRFTRGL